jgi:hypothetical protein
MVFHYTELCWLCVAPYVHFLYTRIPHTNVHKSNGLSWPFAHQKGMWEGSGIPAHVFNVAVGRGELLFSWPGCFMPQRNSL